jgi:hypothetical protein
MEAIIEHTWIYSRRVPEKCPLAEMLTNITE